MAVMTRKYVDPEIEKDVHITSSALFGADLETLCGCAYFNAECEDGVDEPVTCKTCIAIYKDIKSNRKKLTFA